MSSVNRVLESDEDPGAARIIETFRPFNVSAWEAIAMHQSRGSACFVHDTQ